MQPQDTRCSVYRSQVHTPIKKILVTFLTRVIPLVPVKFLDPKRIAADPTAQDAFRKDPLVYHGNVRVRMGMHFLRMEDYVREPIVELSVPLLIFHGGADQLSEEFGSRLLKGSAKSADKTLKIVEGCGHALLHDYKREELVEEIILWIAKRL